MTWPTKRPQIGEPIEWTPTTFCATPLPLVIEDNSEAAWRRWDEAVSAGQFALVEEKQE